MKNLIRSVSGSAICAIAVPTLAQSAGNLVYGPAPLATAVQAVPLPVLFLIPLGIAMAVSGVLFLRKYGSRHLLGSLLAAVGLATVLANGLYVQRVIALNPAIELTNPEGGNVVVPEGSQEYINVSGVDLEILSVTPPETYCVSNAPASECVSGLVLAAGASCSTSFTCLAPVAADAVDDTLAVVNGGNAAGNVLANDLGDPVLNLISFGDSLATVGTFPGDGLTVGAFPAGGGSLDVTINAAGSLNLVANGTTGTGQFTIYYEMQAGNGSTDTGAIVLTFGDKPVAAADSFYTYPLYDIPDNLTGNLFADNGSGGDILGSPTATSLTFGGGSLGGAVTDNAGGASVGFAGGTLTVNNDGSLTLDGILSNGVFSFDYQLSNGIWTSNPATVRVEVKIIL